MRTALAIPVVEPSIVRTVFVGMTRFAALRHGIRDASEWPLPFVWTPVGARPRQPLIAAQRPTVIRVAETWPVKPVCANQTRLAVACCGMRPA